ncbi:ABC transporter permease [Planomonospora sp. ID91781]|uniref:ABC transporter n=1 Tax=Planomonospora sphaerica TaxID=161355 RepID=A0A171DHP2_9ACTN|nr:MULTISPECIES: ABC transporter permease [Planomonospora]MBG0823891.1 ABC transporter permease [Planomonospora sp. ID91781]GAT68541.1 ABC transporter [Planomonospora sphaerica]
MGALIWTELKVLSRSIEFLVVTIAFPMVFFLVMSEVFGSDRAGGLDMDTYMMISMAAFGAMSVAFAVGPRVGLERQAGWNRQLRLTPLPGWGYVAVKISVAMILALPAVLLVFLAGLLIKGIELTAGQWLAVVLSCWISSLPFAVLGLLIGMAVKPDSAQPIGLAVYLPMAMLGGLWMPVDILPGFMASLAKALPSYWLAEITRDRLTGAAFDLLGAGVMAAWFLVALALVIGLYRRDAARV